MNYQDSSVSTPGNYILSPHKNEYDVWGPIHAKSQSPRSILSVGMSYPGFLVLPYVS